ncbi:WecB/TagA/CpsF family glycosyltransferase [Pontibacter sp. JH31]|uniref:WecB/TagA/CpsF family glycosyltransferase n=2 Tax=Pontibacter aquaedesilientis TaxID=2766980 RepID=A0ABR7XH80_9BACT|nr:WecB/TagA/CpsF family glycosyltransferase [Pontibacter aquaedesilientis]
MKRVQICNIPVDALTMQQTIDKVDKAIAEGKTLHHVVVNAAKLVNAQNDQELRSSIVNCDIINADGQAVVWASRLLKQPLPERVAGIDLMQNLVELAAVRGYKIFFLGAKEEIVRKVVAQYSKTYGNEIIGGYRNGYFSKEEEPVVARQIAESKADILFVAMSSPKKEIFLDQYKAMIQTPFIMGVGGSFDVVAGFVRRAPRWMQKAGLEWLYRVGQEPQRMWKRYLVTNTGFIYLIAKEKAKLVLGSKADTI